MRGFDFRSRTWSHHSAEHLPDRPSEGTRTTIQAQGVEQHHHADDHSDMGQGLGPPWRIKGRTASIAQVMGLNWARKTIHPA